MADILTRIKRACLSGDIRFTDKASTELERDGLVEQDVIESIMNADSIDKTIRSTSPVRQQRREYLHVIQSYNLSGLYIYSKGRLVEEHGIETYYVLISAKLAE